MLDVKSHGFLILPEPLFSLIKGLERRAVTNFYGAPGTGKTNICLISAIEVLKTGGQVVYVDTEGSFSFDRFRQLSKNENYLDKLKILEAKSFKEQSKIIRNLQEIEADLIVVDSAVSLYRLESSENNGYSVEANRELSKQLSILSNIARERSIPVIITSHTFKNWETGENEIIGGDPMRYWSKAMIFIEKTNKMGERKVIVTKHRSIEEGKSVKLQITEDGIKPSKFSIF
jgi:DNA repair protein RadB